MSCERGVRQVGRVAAQNGISTNSNRKVHFLGLGIAGIVAAGLFLSWRYLRQNSIHPVFDPAKVKIVSGPERVKPIAAEKLLGRSCAGCRMVAAEKRGWWYNLQGQTYCQDCAQQQAAKAGVTLVLPVSSKPSPSLLKVQGGKRIGLRPHPISNGLIEDIEGYLVLVNSRETGLTITPDFKVEAGGQVTVNKARWFVNYERAGKPIGGPYATLTEARGMASLLSEFDWNRPIEEFSDEEIRAMTQAVNKYRADLEFAQYIRQTSDV